VHKLEGGVFVIVIVVAILGGLWFYLAVTRKRAAELADSWEGIVFDKPSVPPNDHSTYRYVTIAFDDGRREFVRVQREVWETLEVGDKVAKHAGALHPVKEVA